MNKTIKFLPLLATGLLAVGCQDYDAGFTEADIVAKKYANKFAQEFGEVDPNQDWSMATLVDTKVNLPAIQGTAKMNIMTGDPRLSSTRLLAQIMLQDGQGEIQFNAIKGRNNVFVTVEQDGKYKVFGQYSIVNGKLGVGDVADFLAAPAAGLTRAFQATDVCPSKVDDVVTVFSNIASTHTKYHYNGKYYTLEELRAWGEEHKDEMTLASHDPFNNDCVISGTYDFSSATLSDGVIVATDGGYIYNGTFYTETELRAWAQSEYAAGRITADNYSTTTPFGSDCVKTAGYDYSNPQINPATVIVIEQDCIWKNINGVNHFWNSLDEVIAWSKENEEQNQNTVSNSQVLTGLSWNGESLDYSNASLKPYDWGGPKQLHVGDYLFTWNGSTTCYDWDGLINWTKGAEQYIHNDGPLTNVYSEGGLDFSSATIDNTKASTVAAGSYIYDGQVFTSESALQTYTVDNNLDNFGPYENCCQGSHLDFTNATVNETVAPLEYEQLDIKLTYFDNVQHDAAEPWTCGEGYSLFGEGGFFEEQLYYWGQGSKASDKTLAYGPDAETRKKVIQQIEAGFKIKTTGGAINLPFIYGATGKYDQLGYVFYKDDQDPLAQPHYVVIENAMPKENIHKGTETGETFSGTNMYYQFMNGLKDKKTYSTQSDANMQEYIDYYNTKVYGTNYPVIYVDPTSGQATYDIPAGLNMVFFIVSVGNEANLTAHIGYETGNFNYSIPELNKRIGNSYGNTDSPTYNEMKDNGSVKATAWKSGDKVFLGFEDGGADEDLNDIVFLVSGHFSTQNLVQLQPIKWHINKNKSHDTSDLDLFDTYNLKPGDSYSAPENEPVNGELTFLGWSTTPDNSSNDLTKTITNATVPATGKCYFAIWSEPEVENGYTIKWHKNYDGSHDTSDNDLFYSQTVAQNASYTQPASTPAAPDGKVFKGWATSANATESEVLSEEDLANLTATSDMCYFAIWADVPEEVVPDPEWVRWLFACEDLGGTFDYDFNDVVLEFVYGWKLVTNTHQEEGPYGGSGNGSQYWQAYAEIYLHAAGGTLPAEVYYGNELLIANGKSEIHQIFGQEQANVYDIVNATNPMTVTTPICIKKFSDADAQAFMDTPANVLPTVIQNLKVKVTSSDGTSHFVSQFVDSPQTGAPYGGASKTPEIIVLPYDWEWPTENTCIKDAYDFTNWVTNATSTDWLNTKKSGKTVTRSL